MSLPICKFYSLNKSCKFGKHCRFSHLTASDRPPSLKLDTKYEDEPRVKSQDTAEQQLDINQCPIPDNILQENEQTVKTEEATISAGETLLCSSSKQNPIGNGGRKVNRAFPYNDQRAVCRYFLNYGNCRNGRYCRFSHHISQGHHDDGSYYRQEGYIPPRFRKTNQQADQKNELNGDNEPIINGPSAFIDKNDATVKDNEVNGRKICPFFKSGRCWRGQKCKFEHEGRTASNFYIKRIERKPYNVSSQEYLNSENIKPNVSTNEIKRQPAPRTIGFKQIFTYSELEEFGISKVREVDITAMKKRFPKEKITILEEKESFTMKLLFSPTDPDWPFDITQFELLFKVPDDYPKKMMTIVLPVDQDLPETVRRYLEVSIKEWLDHKVEQLTLAGKVELIFRPFLRWLDRNIEELVTEALQQLKRELIAKAAGLEFIPAAKLKARYQTQSESSENLDEEAEQNSMSEEESATSEEEQSSETETDSDEETSGHLKRSLNLDPDKKGTEVTLQHLQLRENASAIMFESLKLIIQCQRCKHHSELKVPQNKVMSIHCEKCNLNQFVNYRPSLIHQFTSVVGYLDVDGCQAFDLILQDSRIVVTCLGCSKQTKLDGMVSGQMIDGWCQACNARFKLATEAVKFTQLLPSGINTACTKVVEVPTTRVKKPPKDPAIREGYPLPEFGTCKHYKHSYRWMRFPCCGKAYPCDVCHDKKEDHEMIMATRMICGHCCKEQNYSGSRPCNSCGQHMTKVRSSHWEGGTGCRDKIAMSKTDQQKYKNMNKTQSNHKKKLQSGATKKNTKLRHS
ncbi:CAunnamed protein product [Biomphalaria glabrata]|nr:CAunnamed protein product [Biomphalaria glabrata]